MKKLSYQYESLAEVYNPETGSEEEKPILISTVIENATDADIERAKEIAWGGEYTLEDDGVEPEPTAEQRITELEEALELLLSGVTE